MHPQVPPIFCDFKEVSQMGELPQAIVRLPKAHVKIVVYPCASLHEEVAGLEADHVRGRKIVGTRLPGGIVLITWMKNSTRPPRFNVVQALELVTDAGTMYLTECPPPLCLIRHRIIRGPLHLDVNHLRLQCNLVLLGI